MPIYVYECKRCSGRFEKLLPIAERNEAQECPQCKEPKTERVIGVTFGLSFGKGFHNTGGY